MKKDKVKSQPTPLHAIYWLETNNNNGFTCTLQRLASALQPYHQSLLLP